MIGITVRGGTHAGWKQQKQPKPWTHECGEATTADYRPVDVKLTLTSYSCPVCGARRP